MDATTCVNLEDIKLSAINQTQKGNCYKILFVCEFEIAKLVEEAEYDGVQALGVGGNGVILVKVFEVSLILDEKNMEI